MMDHRVRLSRSWPLWQETKERFHQAVIGISQELIHAKVKGVKHPRSISQDEFADHLLDVHKQWCGPCSDNVKGRGRAITVSTSTQTMDPSAGSRPSTVTATSSSRKVTQPMMCEEPLPTKTDECRTHCLTAREDMTEDGVNEGVPGEQRRDFQTFTFKKEYLEDYYGEGDKPTEKPDLQATGNVECNTNITNQDDFADEWIENDKSSEELQPLGGEGLPYRMHIKEEFSSEDEYQENDYQREDTGDMEMMAHSISKQDKTSSMEESSEIVRSAKGISQKGGPSSVTPYRYIESDKNGRASEENLPSECSDTYLRQKSIHSPHRPNHDDYLKVVCVEVVDTMDPDFCHEHEQMNTPGEMDCDDELQQYTMCNTKHPK